MMSERHGPDWRARQQQEAATGDPTRDVTVFKDELKVRRLIDHDPQFNQSDPFDGSLRAWRQAARVALSTTVGEPRHVVVARAAAEQSARQAVAETKWLRAMETNQVVMGRAVERFGTDQLKPAAPVISSRAMAMPQEAPAPAADKKLPTWLNRMFGLKATSQPSTKQKLGGDQPATNTVESKTKTASPKPQPQKAQPPSKDPQQVPSPGRRGRSRDDDHGRD